MLSDKIWITRKTRILTEQRIINSNKTTNLLIIWYSTFLVLFSIWNLQYPNENLDINLVFGSIAVLIASILFTSQNFSERSMAMKNCYIKLDELYSRMKNAEEIKDQIVIQDLENEYSGILQNIENHSDFDYLCLRYNMRNNENTTLPKFTKSDEGFYWINRIWRILITMFFFSLPLILSYIGGTNWANVCIK